MSGRALDPHKPHAAGIRAFEDLSSQIGKAMAISPRTVDVYRARLMRKVGAATTPELVNERLAA